MPPVTPGLAPSNNAATVERHRKSWKEILTDLDQQGQSIKAPKDMLGLLYAQVERVRQIEAAENPLPDVSVSTR